MKHRTTMVIKAGRILLLFAVFCALLAGCGGGGGDGGGDDTPRTESSQWDTMVWDQGDWG